MKRRRLLQRCAAIALAASVSLPAAAADGVTRADAKAVRAVIEAQLAAFSADDATRAFSFAAPAIREQFGSADNFMAMVRHGYPVIYRRTSVAFLEPERIGADAVMQRVRMVDVDGRAWIARYLVQRQRDKSWRINGCEVTPDEGRFI